MKFNALFFLLLVFAISSCNSKTQNTLLSSSVNIESESELIRSVMQAQEDAWNKGDIDGFMEGYWNSPELTFIGSSGLTKGWNETLSRYKKSYPDKSAMGKLSFEILKLENISPDAFQMIGRYTLYREKDEPTGLFSLIWRKYNGKWVIVSDQTC